MKLRETKLSCPLANVNLTTRFGVYSFIHIGIMAAALWYIVSNYLINQMLAREWQTTARMVRADVKQLLADEDFKTEDRKSVGHKFDALHQQITLAPDIIRFKVYDPKGVVIWSDDQRLVGQSFSDNDELQEALRGGVVADMSSLNKKENVFEQGSYGRAVEVYVPIYGKNSRELLGVLETYKRADSIYYDVQQARMVVLFGALGGGVLLYLSLFAIVRQAAKKINEQQEHLLKMQSELVASQRMAAVGEMAAAVAHGIGNPLSSIRAAAQVAKLDCATQNACEEAERTQRNLDNIMEQVDRVQRRMRGLLNFVRPLEPHTAPVELNALLRDTLNVLRSRYDEAGVTSRLELAGNIPKIEADANHLEQVFQGLLTNAIEATPRGGTVTVSTKMQSVPGDGRAVLISIEDSGEGIPVENRERVFEPFFTTKAHGTGIGLPLARRFVERNGGTIAITDGPQGGTRIEVALPIGGAN